MCEGAFRRLDEKGRDGKFRTEASRQFVLRRHRRLERIAPSLCVGSSPQAATKPTCGKYTNTPNPRPSVRIKGGVSELSRILTASS